MDTLKKFGWHISEEGLYNYFGDDLPAANDSLHKILLDCDIRELMCSSDRGSLGKTANEKGDIVASPLILQIQKVRNVAVPKNHENDSTVSTRLLRLTLTDGVESMNALEMGTIPGLNANTPPGTKVQLTGSVQNERGFLLLLPSNCKLLGGKVPKLIEKWRLKDPHTLIRSAAAGETGPPRWVPFGEKVKFMDGVLPSMTKNLRVMDLAASNQQAAATAVPEEFNQTRQNVIAQAIKQGEQKVKNPHRSQE